MSYDVLVAIVVINVVVTVWLAVGLRYVRRGLQVRSDVSSFKGVCSSSASLPPVLLLRSGRQNAHQGGCSNAADQ
jgi:hypothetical protein